MQFHLRGLVDNHHSKTQECDVSCWQCKCLSFSYTHINLLFFLNYGSIGVGSCDFLHSACENNYPVLFLAIQGERLKV